MELVAPFQKTHLMLTMSQYNDSDKAILAQAEIHKDQPFFPANTNTYIAASSFRISGFGDLGYIYQYLKPNWFISGELQDEEQPPDSTRWADSGVCFLEMKSEEALSVALCCDTSKFADTNSLNQIKLNLATEFNEHMIDQGTTIKFHYDAANYVVELEESPAHNLRGPGSGQTGLGEIRCQANSFDRTVINPEGGPTVITDTDGDVSQMAF